MNTDRYSEIKNLIVGKASVPASDVSAEVPAVPGLLSYIYTPSVPSTETADGKGINSSLEFFFKDKVALYKVPGTKAEVALPHAIQKKSVEFVLEQCRTSVYAVRDAMDTPVPEEGLTTADILAEVSNKTLLKYLDSEKGCLNFGSYMMKQGLEKSELGEAGRMFLAVCGNVIGEYAKTPSQADPLRDGKNKTITSVTSAVLFGENGITKAKETAKENLAKEIKDLQDTMAMIDTLDVASIISYAKEKLASCGEDNGYIRLKKAKEVKPAVVVTPEPATV